MCSKDIIDNFLQALYERLSAEPDIETVRISEYLERFPPNDVLK
jgi:alpha-amylase/alpha-mannosidase (GH57 family)